MVTGESMPVEKDARREADRRHGERHRRAGDAAEKVGSETVLARIVAMVAEAQRSRAPIQRLADTVAAWFVPAVIAVAVLAFVAWAIWGPQPALAYALVAAVSVLIIACPCALGLATPMSIMVGVGKRRRGRRADQVAEALERMEKVDTLVVDKTGTLTEGKPKVVAVVPGARAWPRAKCCRWRRASSGRASIRSRPPSSPRRRSAGWRLQEPDGFRVRHRQGRDRHGRRAPRRARQCAAHGRSRRRSWATSPASADELRARRRDRAVPGRRRQAGAASSPWPTRSSRRPPDALDRLQADGHARRRC